MSHCSCTAVYGEKIQKNDKGVGRSFPKYELVAHACTPLRWWLLLQRDEVRAGGTANSPAWEIDMIPKTDLSVLLTPSYVAGLLRVSPKTVVVWAREGRIPSIRLGAYPIRPEHR